MNELKRYRSIKTVLAKPMKYHEAGHWGYVRDYDVEKDEQEGYYVEYEDGYKSWSPKETFEKGYIEIEENTMNKQEMIDQLRNIANTMEENDYICHAVDLRQIVGNLQAKPDPIQDIVKLNEERYGLSFNPTQAYSKLYEELEEFKEAELNNDTIEMLDALNDIIVIAVGEIRKMSYNPEYTLNEVVKEISSRKQDPTQERRWLKGDKQPGEKWLKDKSQDPNSLYKADFNKARIK